jgi:hypothetical protein
MKDEAHINFITNYFKLLRYLISSPRRHNSSEANLGAFFSCKIQIIQRIGFLVSFCNLIGQNMSHMVYETYCIQEYIGIWDPRFISYLSLISIYFVMSTQILNAYIFILALRNVYPPKKLLMK